MEDNNIVSLDNYRFKKMEKGDDSFHGFRLKSKKDKIYLEEKEIKTLLNFLNGYIEFIEGRENDFIKQEDWESVEVCKEYRIQYQRIKKAIEDSKDSSMEYVELDDKDVHFLSYQIIAQNFDIDDKVEQKNLEKYSTIMEKLNKLQEWDGRPLI